MSRWGRECKKRQLKEGWGCCIPHLDRPAPNQGKSKLILDCNEFLHTIHGVEDKTELTFNKPAAWKYNAPHFEVGPNCEGADLQEASDIEIRMRNIHSERQIPGH